MAQQESFAHVEFIINGHRFSGWSDDDPPIEFEEEESTDRTIGADGGLYAKSMPNYGTMCNFKMLPTSPTAQWGIQQEQMRKDANFNGTPIAYYSGTFANAITGDSYRLEGGVIVDLPSTHVPGVNYEGSIYFELITSLVDGASFSPPRVTAAA